MSNESIIKELEDQMASAAFNQQVEQHLDSMDLTVLLTARLSGVPSDVLVAVLAPSSADSSSGNALMMPEQHYADLVKQLIDAAIQHSNKE
jgi:deoxyhypusine synthase